MKQVCLLCNKKISFLGNLVTTKHSGGVVCMGCSVRVNEIAELYGKDISCYSIEQAKAISGQHDNLIVHVNKLNEIKRDFDSEIKHFKNEKSESESDVKKDEREIKKIEFEHQQAIKQIEKDYAEINGKAALDTVKKYLKYKSEGRNKDAESVYRYFDKQTIITVRHIEDEMMSMKYFTTTFEKYLVGNKKYVEFFESQIDHVKSVKYMELFAYSVLDMPTEFRAFGFCGAELKKEGQTTKEKTREFLEEMWDSYTEDLKLKNTLKSDKDLALFARKYKELIYRIEMRVEELAYMYDISSSDVEYNKKSMELTSDSKLLATAQTMLIENKKRMEDNLKAFEEETVVFDSKLKELKDWFVENYG